MPAALTDSTRSSKGEKSGGSTAASRKIDAAMENALKKSKLEEQARRARSNHTPAIGPERGQLEPPRHVRGEPEQPDDEPPTDRAAAIERAKSIAASITAAVETEKRASIGSSPQSTIVAFRAYGEKEVREASRDVEAALDSILGQKKPVAPSKKDKPNSPKAMAYKAYEVASGLREEERLRSTQFMAVVSRASSGASEEDQLTAVRAYSSTIQKLMDERMAQIVLCCRQILQALYPRTYRRCHSIKCSPARRWPRRTRGGRSRSRRRGTRRGSAGRNRRRRRGRPVWE